MATPQSDAYRFHQTLRQDSREAELERRIAVLEARLLELEKKPDVVFIRTMQEKLADIERRLAPPSESSKHGSGIW